MEIECQICKKKAIRKVGNQKYCSKECYKTSLKLKSPEYHKRYRTKMGIDVWRQKNKIFQREYRKKRRATKNLRCFYCKKGLEKLEKKYCRTCYSLRYKKEYMKAYWLKKRCGGNAELILNRDNWECQGCGNKTKLRIHHINGNQTDNFEQNLIILCTSCHSRLEMGYSALNRIRKSKILLELLIKKVNYGTNLILSEVLPNNLKIFDCGASNCEIRGDV